MNINIEEPTNTTKICLREENNATEGGYWKKDDVDDDKTEYA